MRITSIETIPIRVPIRQDLAIRGGRGGSHLVSPFLLVKVHTDAGLTGIGEVSCTPRWSGEDQVSAAHFISTYFAPALIGEDPTSIEATTTKFASTVAGNPFTKAGVEMALWDLRGKAEGLPVYQLLGGAVREFVPTKWSVSGVAPAQAADIARFAVEQGFTRMKVKVGIDPESDITRVRAVREAIGPTMKLGVDANGGWPTAAVAIDTAKRLRDAAGIYFIEQPVPPGENDALAAVRAAVGLPLIADESVYTLQDARMLARDRAADVFSIYVGKAGGIGPARAIAAFAQAVGLSCTIGSNLELGVGSAAMTHLALASPGVDAETYPCDIIGPLYYEDEIVREPLPIAAGSARANQRPGLGVELEEEKVERYRVR
ncbi:MAG TPA: enolase C-terminal domain-like protein [Tepidisphaeraceae bacterium]|nr:enolase C-terminal domain-like protein [Tepidisphaeraceae bacterium]